MEIDSILTGKRAVALPFTDCCDPIYQDTDQLALLMEYSAEYGRKSGWRTISIRPEKPFPSTYPPSLSFYGHNLRLSADENALFSTFRGSTRQNIKKAVKVGVKITISDSLDAIKEFYKLNCITKRNHGIPPQPYLFFENVHKHILSKGLGIVVLASLGKNIIAGAVFFHFGKTALYKYGASEMRYQNLRANNYIFSEAIKWYCRKGYESLRFGRTEAENAGLRQFKKGWATNEFTINYYKYSINRRVYISDTLKLNGYCNALIRKMPLALNRIVGSLLYRHVG